MSIVTKKLYHLNGLSTDTKPIPEDIATGSTFLETDTGITFVYNRGINQWVPSTEHTEPQVNAPCVGILSIELTSRAGLIDTYTIRYTNGASTTFNVTNGGYVSPNVNIAKPLINKKLYTVDINTEDYKLYGIATFTAAEVTETFVRSQVIDHTKFWPRKEEGKFALQLGRNYTLIFSYIGTIAGNEAWQAFEVNNENVLVWYVGHFEFVDNHNRDNSNFYFVANKKEVSIIDIKNSIEALGARTSNLEEETSTLNTSLEQEIQRATSVEAALEALINEHIEDYTEVVERLSTEETRSIVADTELEIRIAKEVSDRQRDTGSRAKTEDYNQEIIANKVDVRSFELFGDSEASRELKVATVNAKVISENRALEIYQEVADDQQIPVEKIKVNALDTEITGDLQLDGSVKGVLNLDYITDEYLDDLFPLDPTEEEGE